MTSPTSPPTVSERVSASKVPEVTIWFWLIKILCTTVGESFADWINVRLGVGLYTTALDFTAVLAAMLAIQLRLTRYAPFTYWLTVVIVSVTGTLYTDILTDKLGVPLAVSTTVFSVALAVVFGVWFARERTLSIHSVTTRPRELFYWLAVLVTFALGTAAGDWTLALTGWSAGVSVLLPGGLIVAVVVGWRAGVNAVLSFWLAYILTRPLGANLGDWLATPRADHGLGLGPGLTSTIFLAMIAAAVVYLMATRVDVIERWQKKTPATPARKVSALSTVGYYTVVVLATGALLHWVSTQPHRDTGDAASEDDVPARVTSSARVPAPLASAVFPPASIALYRSITQDALARVRAGDQQTVKTTITGLETAWDHDQDQLQPINSATWSSLDHKIDAVLKSIRAAKPSVDDETRTLTTLLTSLR